MSNTVVAGCSTVVLVDEASTLAWDSPTSTVVLDNGSTVAWDSPASILAWDSPTSAVSSCVLVLALDLLYEDGTPMLYTDGVQMGYAA